MRDFGQCEQVLRHPQIVRREKSREFRILNPGRLPVRVIRIDGCVITRGPRCDWLFLASGDPTEIYVELKGSGIRRPVKQLEATIVAVSDHVHKAPKRCYIVTSRVPRVQTIEQIAGDRFRRHYSAKLKVFSKVGQHRLRRA